MITEHHNPEILSSTWRFFFSNFYMGFSFFFLIMGFCFRFTELDNENTRDEMATQHNGGERGAVAALTSGQLIDAFSA